MRKVAILALDGVIAFDLTIPLEIFSRARLRDGKPCYKVVLCGPNPNVTGSGITFRVNHALRNLSSADTIVIPGTDRPLDVLPNAVRVALLKAHSRGARLVSICSGAFVLAQTGLLNGLTATTHWLIADDLKKHFPEIDVNPDVLYVDSGQILTSAGVCAGLDLCLHIIRNDFGSAVAAHSARLAVMPLERAGGQAQFIAHSNPSSSEGSLQSLLLWIEKNLSSGLTIERIADQAAMSVRTLNRQFHKQVGSSPNKWIQLARIKRARILLETTDKSLEDVASAAGFGSAVTLREQFHKHMKTNPKAYRDSFRGKASSRHTRA